MKVNRKYMLEQKRYSLPSMLVTCFILFCSSFFVTGCSSHENLSSISTETESQNDDYVLLKNVDPPEFMERFAIMYSGSTSTNLYWGYSNDSITQGFFWTTSSYPGFKYTILVQSDYFNQTDCLKLKTKYGEYQYTFTKKYPVFIEDGELINQDSGEKVNRLDSDNEYLVIYSSVQKEAYEYILTKGTEIKIE